MRCPTCFETQSRVLETRTETAGFVIQRRRACASCGKVFQTTEQQDTATRVVIKRDGSREFFDKEKLAKAIRLATYGRPIDSGRLNELTETVTAMVREAQGQVVTSQEIGAAVLRGLRDLDEIAYTQYAIVFLHMRTTSDFRTWLSSQEELTLHTGDEGLWIRKRSGRAERFSRSKLIQSIRVAAPVVDGEMAAAIANDCERQLQTHKGEATTEVIGSVVLDLLRARHETGYLRYAMAFRQLHTVGDLMALLPAVDEGILERGHRMRRPAKSRGDVRVGTLAAPGGPGGSKLH
jgi:transcriptional repressor NrdR